MFDQKDLQLLKVLMGLMANKVKFDDLNAKDVNAVYHSFEFLNELEGKIRSAQNLEAEFNEVQDYCKRLEEELKGYEEPEEEEVKEFKPKRRSRKKD